VGPINRTQHERNSESRKGPDQSARQSASRCFTSRYHGSSSPCSRPVVSTSAVMRMPMPVVRRMPVTPRMPVMAA
jgi:hypothetical protein